MPAIELLAKPVDDEERVIDGNPQTDQGHDVGCVGGYLRDPGQQADARQTTHHGQTSNPQREQGRDHGREHDQQQHQGQRQGDEFRPMKVRLQVDVEIVVDGEGAGRLYLKVV